LLFVSVSIAPEKVFGPQSEAVRQARAVSAFTALANVFFLSMSSLIPQVNVGLVATVAGAVAVLQTLFLLSMRRHWVAEGALLRSLALFLGSAAIYLGEISVGVELWAHPSAAGALTGLMELILGAYAIGLGRAWELLGAPRIGVLAGILGRIDRSVQRRPAAPPPDRSAP
jgi:hypothetical protein